METEHTGKNVQLEPNLIKEECVSEIELYAQERAPTWKYLLILFIITCTWCLVVVLLLAGSIGKTKLKGVFFIMCSSFIAYVVLLIDFYDKFYEIQNWIESSYNRKCPKILVCVFCILSLMTFISVSLSDSTDKNRVIASDTLDTVEYVMAMVCGFLGFVVCIAYWDHLSFKCSQHPFIHSAMYFTILGYFCISICRFIRPPKPTVLNSWSWHTYHPTYKILNGMAKLNLFLFFFLVVMCALVLVLFTEASKSLKGQEAEVIIPLFSVLALSIMITPLAPGSAVDAVGGYILGILFTTTYSMGFGLAWFWSFFVVVILHFAGSCAQWIIGRLQCAQGWMNRVAPVMLLAASDSTLQNAGCIKVGIVGQVFMDTMNGLNQGRMNMPFCTQFWSEWSSIPSAVALVTLGACLSYKEEWTMTAVPIVVLVAGIWQFVASAWGAQQMMSSTQTTQYWTSFEKWTMIQHLLKKGFSITKHGWEADACQLATPNGLFDFLEPKFKERFSRARRISDIREKKVNALLYASVFKKMRDTHYAKFDNTVLQGLIEKKYLEFDENQVVDPNMVEFFEDVDKKPWKRYFQLIMLILMMVFCFLSWIFLRVKTELAVQKGFDIYSGENTCLNGQSMCFAKFTGGIICAAVYLALATLYWHNAVLRKIVNAWITLRNCFTCACFKNISHFETEFKTPKWIPKLKSGNDNAIKVEL